MQTAPLAFFSLCAVLVSVFLGCTTHRAKSPEPFGSANVKLQYKYFKSSDVGLRPASGGDIDFHSAGTGSPRIQPVYVSSKPQLGLATFRGVREEKRWIAADESSGTGTGYDTLYFDGDNDGDLANQGSLHCAPEMHAQSRSGAPEDWVERTTTFGPVSTVVLVNGRPMPRDFSVTLNQDVDGDETHPPWGFMSLAGYFEGMLNVGGKDRRIALTDENANGTYNDPQRLALIERPRWYCVAESDRLWLDLNGDGRFTPSDGLGYHFSTDPTLLLDGACCDLTVAKDGSSLGLSRSRLPCGFVLCPQETFWAALANTDGAFALIGPGRSCVPASSYRPWTCEFTRTDKQGHVWVAPGRFDLLKEEPPIVVKAGRARTLRVGPPFTARLTVEVYRSGSCHIRLVLTGQGGESYYWPAIKKDGEGISEVPFEIVGSAETMAMRRCIRYEDLGDAFFDCFVWDKPAPGVYVATPTLDLGPFQVKCVPTRFTVPPSAAMSN